MADIVRDGHTVVVDAIDGDTVVVLRERIDAAVAAREDGVDVRAGTEWIREAAQLEA